MVKAHTKPLDFEFHTELYHTHHPREKIAVQDICNFNLIILFLNEINYLNYFISYDVTKCNGVHNSWNEVLFKIFAEDTITSAEKKVWNF